MTLATCVYTRWLGSRALASEASQALQASDVKPSYLLHELHSNGTSSVICLYPGLASYVWFKELADAAVDFLATWLQHVPFDGVYLDGFVNANLFANGRAAELKGMVVDSNGDGKADILWRNNDMGAMSVWEMNGDASSQRYDFGFDADLAVLAIRDLSATGEKGILAQSASGDLAVFVFNSGEAPTIAQIGQLSTDWELL